MQNDMRQQTRLLKEQVRLQRQQNRRIGCLSGVVWTVLFGPWLYWPWLAIKWTVRGTVALSVLAWVWLVLGWKWASVWTWRGSVWTAGQLVTLARAAYARMRGA